MVYWALYGVLGSLGLFVLLYILAGTFVAVGICVPAFFICMYLITRIQKNYGHQGWQKRRIARQLPLFISIKKRICKVA